MTWAINRLTVPTLFALGFALTFTIGCIGLVFLHYVVFGFYSMDAYYFYGSGFQALVGVSATFAFFALIYLCYPKITGRMLNYTFGKIHFCITFVGSYLICFFMSFLGSVVGVPLRYYEAGSGETFLTLANLLIASSAFCALVVGLAQLLFIYNLVHSYFRGARTNDRPWGEISVRLKLESSS